MRALLLPVGAELYALDVQAVREVVAHLTVTAIPGAPRTVLGLINVRGEIVPIFDTAALLDVGRLATGSFAAIVYSAAGPVGLAVSGMPESVELGVPEPVEVVAGVATFALGERLATLVDVDHLVAAARIGSSSA